MLFFSARDDNIERIELALLDENHKIPNRIEKWYI
jgi:hypothetical protein